MSGAAAKRDVFAGALLSAIGLAVLAEESRHSIGALSQMRAGYFPLMLGILLSGPGVLIAASGLLTRSELSGAADTIHPPDLRGCAAIVLSVMSFVVLGQFFGLAPATFVAIGNGARDATFSP